MLQIEDSDKLCKCGHPGLDHGLWMGVERMEEIAKKRKVGCRVIGCGCEEWKSAFGDFYTKWDIGNG